MVRVTFLFPTKKVLLLLFSFCSHEKLDLQSSNSDPSTRSNQRANIQSKQQDTSNNNTPNKRKALKEHTKG